MTPGVVDETATKEKVCTPGYAKTARNVPQHVKNEAYQEYGIFSHQEGEYEVDHLISLELGGSNNTRNLWPETYSGIWGARVKDGLENRLHTLVCDGKVSLREAQYDISHNWIKAYCKYMNNTDNCRGVTIE